jgi:hypothetical protein
VPHLEVREFARMAGKSNVRCALRSAYRRNTTFYRVTVTRQETKVVSVSVRYRNAALRFSPFHHLGLGCGMGESRNLP